MSSSTKPYLIRALHQWCTDNGHTPYVVVWVNEQTEVPREYVQNNEIVLNISLSATKDLNISNQMLSFEARFAGVVRQVSVPLGNVMSIFARETGEGMGFEVELAPVAESGQLPASETASDKPKGPPKLRIVK